MRVFALVLVFNAPDLVSPDTDQEDALRNTQNVLKALRSKYHFSVNSHIEYSDANDLCSIYLIDKTIEGSLIPPKQGVGLARKLGMDLALNLCVSQWKEFNQLVSWIHSTDADVCLPDDYFEAAQSIKPDTNSGSEKTTALIYPFKHEAIEGFETAMALYELSLNYYVEKLKAAGSPYAFHTIGSLIVVDIESYASVRGVPKRSGGEDFYLLNKLAKLGVVTSLDEPVVKIAGRPSSRVPFGTGPALSKIAAYENPSREYTFYNPATFELLKCLLDIVANAKESFPSLDIFFESIRARMTRVDSKRVIDALTELNIEKQFRHLSSKRTPIEFQQAFHIWFDAFLTLRFIHLLRDAGLKNVTLDQIDAEFFEHYRACYAALDHSQSHS